VKRKCLLYREGVVLRGVAHNIKKRELEFISFIGVIKRKKEKKELE
jgi:hypothetical protein